jgi:hypothetical protein
VHVLIPIEGDNALSLKQQVLAIIARAGGNRIKFSDIPNWIRTVVVKETGTGNGMKVFLRLLYDVEGKVAKDGKPKFYAEVTDE